jgi:hypothetical protein
MKLAYTLDGSAPILKKLKLGASVATAGIPVIADASNDYGECIPATTTSAADTYGVAIDTGTYTTTQSATMVEGVVTVIINPNAVWKALMSGGATSGTTLQVLESTVQSTAGTTITDSSVGSATMAGGTAWGVAGGNVGHSRIITTFNSGTSIVVTVPFPQDIETTDDYAQCPWSRNGSNGNLQLTSTFEQANAAIVVGTGCEVAVVELDLNGLTDSYVLFKLTDHVLGGYITI